MWTGAARDCYDGRVEAPTDWSVYIARCVDGSLYTGIAKDVKARLAVHNAGKGAAYTRARRPVRLVYREDGMTRSAALSREAGIKSLDRARKLSLVKAARKALAAVALLVIAAVGAHAVPSFAKEDPVVFSSAVPQAFTGAYPNLRMYFIRQSSGIEVGSALSADGVNWLEDGPAGRLSTSTLPTVFASSITGAGVLPLTGGGFRMEYSIVSTTGSYRIHSATSADGLSWANDTGVRIDNALTYLSSPKIVKLNDASWRMYYVGGTGGGIGSLRVFSTRSTDQGLTWTTPSIVISTLAYEVGASVLTNGLVRLYYSQPLSGSTTSTTILSALSSDVSGSVFSLESGIRVSTALASGAIDSPVPVRSTDTFRWRLYYDFSDPGTVSTGDIHSALTAAPAPVSITPSHVLNLQSTVTFTVSGDVFSLVAPTVFLSLGGQPNILATGLTRVDDQTLTMSFDVFNQTVGLWGLTVTNADSQSTTLPLALNIDFAGGSVGLVGNLLRPRNGVPTTITVTTYNDGHLLLRLYTLDGRPVRTLYDAPLSKGIFNITWDGTDAGGSAVASGVYLLRTIGPKIDLKSKIVVIR